MIENVTQLQGLKAFGSDRVRSVFFIKVDHGGK